MDADLILMGKAGETLEVHPSCVAAHERAGWAIAPTPDAATAPEPDPAVENNADAATAPAPASKPVKGKKE